MTAQKGNRTTPTTLALGLLLGLSGTQAAVGRRHQRHHARGRHAVRQRAGPARLDADAATGRSGRHVVSAPRHAAHAHRRAVSVSAADRSGQGAGLGRLDLQRGAGIRLPARRRRSQRGVFPPVRRLEKRRGAGLGRTRLQQPQDRQLRGFPRQPAQRRRPVLPPACRPLRQLSHRRLLSRHAAYGVDQRLPDLERRGQHRPDLAGTAGGRCQHAGAGCRGVGGHAPAQSSGLPAPAPGSATKACSIATGSAPPRSPTRSAAAPACGAARCSSTSRSPTTAACWKRCARSTSAPPTST